VDAPHRDYVVNPAIPILYFGDVEQYFKSKNKIITVGKNPSLIEFCEKKGEPYSFLRFPHWEEKKDYATELNSYFECEPYKSWFGGYEAILNGINTSYYSRSNKTNRAIHTDICSPIATNPTWSNLPQNTQTDLFKKGFNLWSDLINILQPDIILVSIAENWLSKLELNNKTEFKVFNKKKDGSNRQKLYIVYHYSYFLKNGKTVRTFFGQAAEKPFGTLSDIFKGELGTEILGQI
jgi:hypothetical protein